jgi:hypothetical protein
MKAWEHIIHAAMLGTDKPMPGSSDWPEDLTAIAEIIDGANNADKESRFLKKAAVIYNYRQCGFAPAQKTELTFTPAAPETYPYCSDIAAQLLNAILNEDNIPLLELWLTLCSQNQLLLPPDLLPAVLDKAIKAEKLQPLIIACSGNRGEWLSKLNPEWNYFASLPDEETWQTGNLQDRVKVLRKVRLQEPEKALAWIQQTWPQENAASKQELLSVLQINLSDTDLSWLETLMAEKSQKVKEQVLRLLKQLPESSIVQSYQALLSQSVTLKKEKALLGLVNKVTLQFKLPDTINESIFSTSIEKMAGPNMPFNDEGYILYQLISAIPPAFWLKHLEASITQVIEYFGKYAADKMPALINAVIQFKSHEWAPLMAEQNQFYPDLGALLSPQLRDEYLLRFIKRDAQQVIHTALSIDHEWKLNFTVEALRYMVNNLYQYGRVFFGNHIQHFPATVQSHLDGIEAEEPYAQSTWEKNRRYLQTLLSLKQQTHQAFNA